MANMETELRIAERTAWKGDISYTALRKACELLEVKKPVIVKKSNGTRRIGCHRFRDGQHSITVSGYLPRARAIQTLLHELTHAAQSERYESHDKFVEEYCTENRRRGYQRNRFEVEANAAKDFWTEFPTLCR